MNDIPVVSVILPVRDAAATIHEALRSVLTQTFRAFEVIAVDDGSTDGSADVVREASQQDARIRVVGNRGRGLTVALNTGIALAAGRFIARQDADDISMPERFARQVEWLERHSHICAIGTETSIIDETGRLVGRFPIRHGADAVRNALRAVRATPVHGSMMIRREALDAVGGYREAFSASQDFDLWLRLTERFDIDNLAEPLYRWRLSRGSVYGDRRQTQFLYGGIGLAFAAERARFGTDSYALLEEAGGDLEAFAAKYRLRGFLHALWGELLLRGTNDSRLARRQLGLALRHGHVRMRTLLLWGWTSSGFGWIGSKPLRVPDREHEARSVVGG